MHGDERRHDLVVYLRHDRVVVVVAAADDVLGWRIAHSHGGLVQPRSGAMSNKAVRTFGGLQMGMTRISSGSVRRRRPNVSPAICSSRPR